MREALDTSVAQLLAGAFPSSISCMLLLLGYAYSATAPITREWFRSIDCKCDPLGLRNPGSCYLRYHFQ